MKKSIKEKLEFIDSIEEFPSMPSMVLNLMSRLNNPDITVKEIEKMVNMDPALVSYVLKITNSLIFGLREEVYVVSRAVTLIGTSNLKSLLSSYAIRMLCKTISHVEAQQYIWKHSLAVAVLARCLSNKVFGKEHPQAYVLGLLHDVGKIVLYMVDSKRFMQSLETGVTKNLDFISAEKKLFGYSHIETGFFMAGKMGFSKKMKDIILFHHDPEFGPTDKLLWVISLADQLSHHLYDNKTIDVQRYLEHTALSENQFNDAVVSAKILIKQYQDSM